MRNTHPGTLTSNTTSIKLTQKTGRKQHQIRFVFGYALDGSTFPRYFLWPTRTRDAGFQLLDSSTGYVASLPDAFSIKPLGLEHFYDAFSIDHKLDLRAVIQTAFALPAHSIMDDLSVVYETAVTLLPHLGREYPLPAEEEDKCSVISIASSNDPPRTEQEDTDTDDSQSNDTGKVLMLQWSPQMKICQMKKAKTTSN